MSHSGNNVDPFVFGVWSGYILFAQDCLSVWMLTDTERFPLWENILYDADADLLIFISLNFEAILSFCLGLNIFYLYKFKIHVII